MLDEINFSSMESLVCLAGIIFIIIKKTPQVQYFLKMTIIVIGIFISSLTLIPFVFTKPDYRNGFGTCWGVTRLAQLMGITFEFRGIENVKKDKGGIILINHQSLVDVVGLAHIWPNVGRLTVVAKKMVLYIYPFSYFSGILYINRSDRRQVMNQLNRETIEIQNKATKLLVFPEGTRNHGDQLLPFKKGSFHIAIQSQSHIQPVVISKYKFIDSKQRTFGKGHSIISFLPVIDCRGLTDVNELIDRTRNIMQAEYDKLNAESIKFS